MAKKIWNNPIDKNVDWGGDDSTEGMPVSGEMVQKYIKDSLNSKAGIFYYDTSNNRYIVFSDELSKDEYLEDPTKTHLIIGTFDAPFNYTASINLTSKTYNAVFLNSTGNYIDFTFDVVNKQGASTGESVTVTYTFIRNANKQTVTETRRFGDVVHFNIDKYLGEGTNTIMVGITGQTSLAATTVAITYQVVNLFLSDDFNISKVYNLKNSSQQVEIPFTVSGYGTKIVEWYIDGELLPFVKSEDEIVDVSTSRTKYITLSNLSQGTHSLQIRAYTVINGEQFYTDTLYRDLIVYTNTSTDVIIGIATTIPREYGILSTTDNLVIYGITQYVPYTLRFATYSPLNAANTEVSITIDGELKGVVGSKNNIENAFVFTSTTNGNKTLKLTTPTSEREVTIAVNKTSMNIDEIEGAIIDFTAIGKNNGSTDRDTWTDGIHTGTLTGFNWNNSSGWVNGRLEMSAGSSLAIDYAPLANNPTNTGKTIEIEWMTKNVTNDDAIICDLRGDNGVGILITATKVSMISADGVVIETEYKSDENIRLAFVINKSSGVTNRRLSFIYTNGIVSRAEQWASTDNYTSNKELVFTATEEAEISLKQIRIYDNALSSDNILNNFILYRDTIAEMMEVYDRNDVYEDGTTAFSPDKMMNRLPVMIVTGDIPTLENTSDKNEQIVVDIEYYNVQDPSRSFTMKNAAMRPQGTSSMGYPKKNFRIYTQKVANTELYDANGNIVEDKLYAFKANSQPVNCWCLKADYAESSGTHNVGIARLWNTALYNAQIDGEYKFRTEAQKKALESGYNYDVRTTIDGFPILLFYRPQANDDLIFIGKYNFNNDKSTEKVFGFTDIPGFDNSKMQCWEILNNGNPLALFTTTDGFDSGWSEAFESRYPDTKTPYLGDLKAFCEWMTAVSTEDFKTQKWEHLDVYKMAAYWIYLMRHAAADQFAKNAMLTSEDGVKFYFIHYDNDTINGLINTGHLRIKPTDGRQSLDETGSYLFAGHESRLWNMLEADEEFISIVSEVDNALYTAGISYANTIKVFDEDQADKWVEKVYNQDAQYKYIGPYVEKGINNLFMLQGKRDLHRKWWLAKRFSIFDAKYVSGSYKSQAVEIKCLNETQAGQQFTIRAGYPIDYGYGINNIPRSFGIPLEIGDYHTFTTQEVINLGDPLRIYGAPNIWEIDFSAMSERLAVMTIANVYDDNLGTKLTKLTVGNPNKTNAELAEISGLKQATALEYLDIQGMTNMNSVDLSNHQYFKTLKAFGSGISSATFTKGSPVERLEFPASLRTLTLNQLPYLNTNNIIFENVARLQSIDIRECPSVSNNFDFIYNWYTNKSNTDIYCSLYMDNVLWENIDPNKFLNLIRMKQRGGNIDLKGKVTLPTANLEIIYAIRDVFSETAFYPSAEFYIQVPTILGIESDRDSILEGENLKLNGAIYPPANGTFKYSLIQNRTGCTIDQDGLLTTVETGLETSNVTVKVEFTSDDNTINIAETKDIQIVKRIYPEFASIEGEDSPLTSTIYVGHIDDNNNITGEYTVEWNITGTIADYYQIDTIVNNVVTLKELSVPYVLATGYINIVLKKKYNNQAFITVNKPIEAILPGVVINSVTNAPIQKILYNNGLVANEHYSLKEEVEKIKYSQLNPSGEPTDSIFYSGRSTITHFEEFEYFTGVTQIPSRCFAYLTKMTVIVLPNTITTIKPYAFGASATTGSGLVSITLPDSIRTLDNFAFTGCQSLKTVIFNDTLTTIGNSAFNGCKSLNNIILPNSLTSLGESVFNGCTSLSNVSIPASITNIKYRMFYGCTALKTFVMSNAVTTLGSQVFLGSGITNITLSEGLTALLTSVFSGCKSLQTITLPSKISSIGDTCFSGCTNLKEIICLRNTAPTVTDSTFGTSDSTYTGRDTYNQNVNFLRVPQNATGYEDSYWGSILLDPEKCGFKPYGKLTINSNKQGIFAVTYTNVEDVLSNININNGTTYIQDIKYNTDITLYPITTGIGDYDWTTKTFIYNRDNNTVENNVYVYPTSVSVSGDNYVVGGDGATYIASVLPDNIDVECAFNWSISGSPNVEIMSSEGNMCKIRTNAPESEELFTVICTVTSSNNKVTVSDNQEVRLLERPNFITATYNVTSTTSATQLVYEYFNVSDITYMEIDGVVVTPSLSYTFSSTGIHTVKFSVETIYYLFSTVDTLTSVDFSECDGAKYTSASCLFQACTALTTINWGECTFPNITNISSLIRLDNLENIDLSPFKDAPITDISYMCFGCKKLKDINLGVLQNAVITKINNAFCDCEVITSIDLSKLQFGFVSSLSSVFSGCKSLLSINWGDNTFGGCTNIHSLFNNCESLTSIDLSPLKGSHVSGTSFSYTFSGCKSLTSIDLSPLISCTLNSSSSNVFYGCVELKTIIVPWLTAPEMNKYTFGSSTTNYTGRNTYNASVNKLYVPTGATGYDSGYWKDPLCDSTKCGFTLSATL